DGEHEHPPAGRKLGHGTSILAVWQPFRRYNFVRHVPMPQTTVTRLTPPPPPPAPLSLSLAAGPAPRCKRARGRVCELVRGRREDADVLKMSGEERRARLVSRHLLDVSEPDPLSITSALVALHSTDPASVHLSAAARGCPPQSGALDRALYEERSLVRMLGMRRTMFVVATDFAPIMHAAATRAIAERERSRLIGFIEAA